LKNNLNNQGNPPFKIRMSPDFLPTKKGLHKKHSASGSKQIAFGTIISVIIRGKLNKGDDRYSRKNLSQKLITSYTKKPNPS
jgi:hypothetical protein